MSLRELKALGVTVGEKGDSQISKRTTRNTRNAMAEERIKQLEQELAAVKLANEQSVKELAETQAANEEKDRQLQAANEDKDRVCEEKDREVAAAKAECAGKDRELEEATAQIAKLTTDSESRLEEVKVRFELDKLRAIE